MEYIGMTPSFTVKPYNQMSNEEALQLHNWFINEIPVRIDYLSRWFSSKYNIELDFSSSSLRNICDCFSKIGSSKLISKEELESQLTDELSWIRHVNLLLSGNKYSVNREQIVIAIDIAIYYATIIIRNNSNIKWDIYQKDKNHWFYNHTVLSGFRNNVVVSFWYIHFMLCLQKDLEYDWLKENILGDNQLPVGHKFTWDDQARDLLSKGFPAMVEDLPVLLDWLIDLNWPGAMEIKDFLISLGVDILPYLDEQYTNSTEEVREIIVNLREDILKG